ncbi:MAG: CAP domain-containing protein [Telluria sp.]
MSALRRLRIIAGIGATALWLAACGGGGGGNSASSSTSASSTPLPTDVGAPALTSDIATDGRNWINYRRGQVGMSALSHNNVIDIAALGHSQYQRTNNTVTHVQTVGKPGFTGVTELDRLTAAGYSFANTNHAYGEVISATSSQSGAFMAEELITAIYHRFVIFEPVFKEIGTGAASNASGYAYFTADFTANNGYGAGLPPATVAVWPFSGQTQVPINFFSDYEEPDPVPGANEVGYPISVHANITSTVKVQSFTVRPRGGSDLTARQLAHDIDPQTPASAAAIIPLSRLANATTYDVSFSGTVDGIPVTRSWSFTTK